MTPQTAVCQAPLSIGFWILGWLAISFSRGSSQPRGPTHIFCLAGRFFTTEPAGKPYYVQYERKWKVKVLVAQLCLTFCNHMDNSPPLSMGFSRQEHWSGLPFPSPGALPNPGIEPGPPTLQVNSLLSQLYIYIYLLSWRRGRDFQALGHCPPWPFTVSLRTVMASGGMSLRC